MRKRRHKDAIAAAMISRETRSVYAAIVLGAKSLTDIFGKIDINAKTANKIIARLLGLGLIQRDGTGFFDVDSIWRDNAAHLRHGPEDFSNRQIETDYVI